MTEDNDGMHCVNYGWCRHEVEKNGEWLCTSPDECEFQLKNWRKTHPEARKPNDPVEDLGNKLGGRGLCPYCDEWHNNVAYHSAHQCPKRPLTPSFKTAEQGGKTLAEQKREFWETLEREGRADEFRREIGDIR